MSRFRPTDGPAISLFPFLAVLLCTMGALLVLLVIFSRASGHQGETPEQVRAREQREADLAIERESLAWRLDQVKTIRSKTADDLAKARLQLAGIEEHVRSLTDELDALNKEAAALAVTRAMTPVDDQEIARLEQRLKSARESLDEKHRDMQSRPAKYAVVPYEGPSGTHRRPLYIECSIEGVYLQPEGIRLTPSDFEGPSGPGNPLASALRAAREHIANTTPPATDAATQPYPLLLVRPSGVMAYYAAREAIQSWGSDFGYQLIDEDWTLEFPPRDPALADVEKRAVDEARERLAWLMSRRPSRPARPTTQYRASTTRGGVVSNDGPSLLGDQSQWDWSRQQAARGIRGGDGGGSGFGGGSGDGTGNGTGSGLTPASESNTAGGGSALDGSFRGTGDRPGNGAAGPAHCGRSRDAPGRGGSRPPSRRRTDGARRGGIAAAGRPEPGWRPGGGRRSAAVRRGRPDRGGASRSASRRRTVGPLDRRSTHPREEAGRGPPGAGKRPAGATRGIRSVERRRTGRGAARRAGWSARKLR